MFAAKHKVIRYCRIDSNKRMLMDVQLDDTLIEGELDTVDSVLDRHALTCEKIVTHVSDAGVWSMKLLKSDIRVYLLVHPTFPVRRRMALVQQISQTVSALSKEQFMSKADIKVKQNTIEHMMQKADASFDIGYLNQATLAINEANSKYADLCRDQKRRELGLDWDDEADIEDRVKAETMRNDLVSQMTVEIEESEHVEVEEPDNGQVNNGRMHMLIDDREGRQRQPKPKKGFFKKAFGWLF